MLTLDIDLPPGALLPAPDARPALPQGAICYRPDPDAGGPAKRLTDAEGHGPAALPVEGNTDGCPVERIGGTPHLAFRKGEACGFASEQAVEMAAVSVAVVFRAPEGDPRTLAALCPPEERRYLHLTLRDGVAEFAFRDKDGARLPLDAGGGAPRILMASAAGGRLALGTGDGPPATAAPQDFVAGPYQLFIGCRRVRAGLKNSLGAARVAEVIFLPDLDIFAPEAAPHRAALRARLTEHDLGL